MAELMLVNPRKRRARKEPSRKVTHAKTAVKKRARTRRNAMLSAAPKKRRYKNPRGLGGMAGIMGQVAPAATAAAGGLVLDVVWGFLPLPDVIKSGPMRHLAKGAGAIGLGVLAGMVVNKATANKFATGALTVVLYNAAREVVAKMAPQLRLGEYEEDITDMSAYIENNSVGEYLEDDRNVSGFSETYQYDDMTV
jgi:hypothetical protein